VGSPATKASSRANDDTRIGPECTDAPVPRLRPEVPAVAFARGDGPVYVGLGTARAVHYMEDTPEHGGWFYYKTLWAVSPGYGGQVTITGRQVGGPNILRFNAGEAFPGKKQGSLRFSPQPSRGWRYGPSSTLIRAPGCYAFEIRGDAFTEFVTFRARP
jgi:hypothetical protein